MAVTPADLIDYYDREASHCVRLITVMLADATRNDLIDWPSLHATIDALQDCIDMRERVRFREEGSHLHLTQTSFTDIQE